MRARIKINIQHGVLVILATLALVFFMVFSKEVRALTGPALQAPLSQPTPTAQMVVSDTSQDTVQPSRPWQPHRLLTAGLQFAVRGKEALGWSLDIDSFGFENPAIRQTYQKVLTIVNSLFILGLLAIAGLWLFNAFIPRQTLRRVMILYTFAVIFVNFAFPFNQLLIDGTNLLQQAFLMRDGNRITVADVVQLPDYQAANAESQATAEDFGPKNQRFSLQFQEPPPPPGMPLQNSANIGQLTPTAALTQTQITGVIGNQPAVLNIDTTANQATREIRLGTSQPVSATLVSQASEPPLEISIFAFAMLFLTGLAYFAMAGIFVLRVVILWALLILSPLLLFLAIFQATRGYFYNWLAIYGRWLFIGPLTALGIALVVNIWQAAGLPITSTYTTQSTFGVLSNIAFYLPGGTDPNTLSTPGQMMEYLIFLAMLYLPIFFAFALTRQKHFASLLATAKDHADRQKERMKSILPTQDPTSTPGQGSKTMPSGDSKGLVHQFKGFFDTQLSKLTQTAMPRSSAQMEAVASASAPARSDFLTGVGTSGTFSAASFLPSQMAHLGLPDLLGMITGKNESRHARSGAISQLAAPELIKEGPLRRRVEGVRMEIERRATRGDLAAGTLKSEIEEERRISVHKSDNVPLASTIVTNQVEESSTVNTSNTTVYQPRSASESHLVPAVTISGANQKTTSGEFLAPNGPKEKDLSQPSSASKSPKNIATEDEEQSVDEQKKGQEDKDTSEDENIDSLNPDDDEKM